MHSSKIFFLMVCVGFYTHVMICSDHEKTDLPRTDSEQKAYDHLTGEQLAGDSMYGPRTTIEITPKKRKKPQPLLFLQSPISSQASAFPGQTPVASKVSAFPVAWSQDFDGDRKVKHGRSFFGTEVQSGRGTPEDRNESPSQSPVNAEQTEELVESADAVRPEQSASSGQVAGYIESPKSSVDDSSRWDRQAQRGGVQDVPAKSCLTRFLMLCGCYKDAKK